MNWNETRLKPLIGSALKAVFWTLSKGRLPQTRGTLPVTGLAAPVEVLRDRWGVPHIYAHSIHDVLYAQGFVHAQERLWQMDFARRVIAGRLAEVLGVSALPFDRAMRTLGLRRVAEQEARATDGEFRALLDAYCAGANAWIETASARHKLPVEFMLLGYAPEPWQVADSLSWEKLLGWTLAGNWSSEFMRGQIIRRLGPDQAAQLEVSPDEAWAVILDVGKALGGGGTDDATRSFIGAGAGEGVGSNNWVIHGTRTASGRPLLANDMHLELRTPAIWYENHLAGGELEVTGVSLPGVPLVISGHNRHVAWGYTDGLADVQDLYEEHLRRTPAGDWEYEFRGQWLPATVRQEEIRIKGGNSALEPVVCTGHGPVVNMLFKDAFPDAPPLALRWTAMEPEKTVRAIHAMNRAPDCQAFREALRDFDGPPQNTVYADTQGNIAYSLTGKIPVRAQGDGSVPVPGWTGEHEWTGYIPFEGLPHLYNPPRGYVVTANNQVHRPDFPYFIARDYLVGDRAERIDEMITAAGKIDVPYIQQMHFDQISPSARRLVDCLTDLEVADPELQGVVGQMRAWDGKLTAASPWAAVFEVATRQAVRLLLEHKLGDLGRRVQGQPPASGMWGDHAWEWFFHLLDKPNSPWFDLGQGETRDDVLRQALRQAVDFLKQAQGPDMEHWQWGRLHQLTFGHTLGQQAPLNSVFNLGPYPIGGDSGTIWATHTSLHDLSHTRVVGSPFRFIADLGDLDHCWGLLAPGQSGHLASPHFADGVEPWFTANYHPMLVLQPEVEQNLEARLILVPGDVH